MAESRERSDSASDPSRRAILAAGAALAAGCTGAPVAEVGGRRLLPTTEAAIDAIAAAGGPGQLFVWHDGKTLVDRGFGAGVQAGSLVPWASACKPTTVAAVLRLVDAGEVRLDDRVTRFIPAFGEAGKTDITLRHLMTHTAALGGYAGPRNLPQWEDTIAQIVAAPRTIQHGQAAPPPPSENRPAYNPAGLWILGEVLRIVHERPFPELIRSEVYLPLDMDDCWNGMPGERVASYRDNIVRGGFQGSSSGSADPGTTPAIALRTNPAGGAVGPLRELGNFYRMALDGGAWRGKRFLEESTIGEAIAPQASNGSVWTFGLGFLVNKAPAKALAPAEQRLRYGQRPSTAAFGHNGATGTVAFADPAVGLVVVMIGLPLSVSDGVYAELGLA